MMRQEQPSNRECGISIVEILVALAVIAVMFAALVNVQLQSLQVSRASKQASSATQIANELITEMTQTIFEPQTSTSLDEWIVHYYGCDSATTLTIAAPYNCTGAGGVTSSTHFDSAVTTGIAGADQYTYSFTITGLKTLAGTTTEKYLRQGLVALTMSITGPSDAEITVLLSCLDATFTPQLQQGEPCPDPTTGT